LFVPLFVDGRRLLGGPRFQQALDEKAGLVQLLAGVFEWCQPVADMPPAAPRLLDDAGLEVVAAVPDPIAGGMLARQDQSAVGAKDAPKFA
jgi:hypothetical protein